MRDLVGRDTELELLDRLLGEACEGSPRMVVVTGEPGIGKSSLLAELTRRADGRGCLALTGRATELEQELPFGLVVDAFDAYLESMDARTFDRLGTDELGELAAVFPSLRSLDRAAGDPSTAAERFRAHHAVRELMERLAARQPVVVVFDDVHWCDGASLELITHLLRRHPDAAVLVAIAFRTGRAPPTLAAAIDAAAREGTIEQVALRPLALGDATQLVPDGAERLYEASGGNPFYLLQLARVDRGPQGVPAQVATAIADELRALAPGARRFAEAASVAGDPFELDVAVAVAEMPEADALVALDELVARDLARQSDLPRQFHFRHPLVRSAIYNACTPGARLAAHGRAAAVLAQRGEPATARAHHVEQSARHGDLDAIAVLREAGNDAAQRAPASAARWYEAALRLLPASASPRERAELLMALAPAQAAVGRLEDARAALVATLALDVEDASIPRVAVVSACANVEQLLGRRDEAHARLLSALDALPERESTYGAALMVSLAIDGFIAMDYEGMRTWGREALATATPLAHRPLMAASAAILAMAEASTGDVSDAMAHVTQAAALVDAMPDSELGRRIDAMAHLCGAEYLLDRFEDAARHAERGLAVARATNQGDFFPTLTQALGGVMYSTGRFAEAAELFDAAAEAARLTDNALSLGWTLLNRVSTCAAMGEIDEALRAGEEAVATTRSLGRSVIGAWAGAVYGGALLDAGRPARAIDVMVESAGGDDLPLIPGALRANFLEILTRALLAEDRLADAERTAALSGEIADRFGLRLARAAAARAAGAVALHAGDARGAAEQALASAAVADEIGALLEGAMSRTLAGRALGQLGETDRAAAELERAAAELDACGARRHRERAEQELRRLGRTVHRRTRRAARDGDGLASLTGREHDVARLVVDRRTNPEIAAELFLSVKTVESHMSNIFRKLDATSRVEVARIVERAGAA